MDSSDWQPPTEAEMKLIQARRERSDKISKLMSSYLLKGYKMLGSVCSTCDTILLQDRQGNNYCVACSELDSDTDKDNPLTNQSAAISMAREIELATGGSAQAAPPNTRSTARVSTRDTASIGTPRPQGHLAATETVHPDPDNPANGEDGLHTLSMSSIDIQSWPANAEIVQPELSIKPEQINNDLDPDSGLPSLSDPRSSPIAYNSKSQTSSQQFMTRSSVPSSSLSSTSIARLCEKVEWASRELKDTCSVEYSIQLCQLIKNAAEAVVAVRSARI